MPAKKTTATSTNTPDLQACDGCGKKVADLFHDEATGTALCDTCTAAQAKPEPEAKPKPARRAPAKKAAPAPKKPEVDLLRETPFGTGFRIVRAATAGIVAAKPWVTICTTHNVVHEADTLRAACFAGTRGSTAGWCKECAKTKATHEAEAKKAATARAAAKKAAAKAEESKPAAQ